MASKDLEQKLKDKKSAPFHTTPNAKWNDEVSAHFPDPEHFWVGGIYKKDLISLGATIIKSDLGGRIGFLDGFASTWFFLISKEDHDRIMKDWKEKLDANVIRTMDSLREAVIEKGFMSIGGLREMMEEVEDSDAKKQLETAISEFEYSYIKADEVLELME